MKLVALCCRPVGTEVGRSLVYASPLASSSTCCTWARSTTRRSWRGGGRSRLWRWGSATWDRSALSSAPSNAHHRGGVLDDSGSSWIRFGGGCKPVAFAWVSRRINVGRIWVGETLQKVFAFCSSPEISVTNYWLSISKPLSNEKANRSPASPCRRHQERARWCAHHEESAT
jgi:hypothetical protein